MKIKRFFSQDMRSAIRMVREELGADAVILSNDRVNGGVEIVAAVDYDEAILKPQTPSNENRHSGVTTQSEATRGGATRGEATNDLSGDSRDSKGNKQPLLPAAKSVPVPASAAPQAKRRAEAQMPEQQIRKSAKQDPAHSAALRNEPALGFDEYNDELLDDDEAFFDPDDYSDYDDYTGGQGNKHLSASLQNRIDSAFKPANPRKESPYLRFHNDENANEYEAFLSLDESMNEESKINDTLYDTTQGADFSAELLHGNSKSENKNYSVWSQEPTLVAMRNEITSLRGMLEQQLTGLAWNDLKKNNPQRAKLIKQLLELGFSPELADQVIHSTDGQADYQRGWQLTLAKLAEKLPIKDDDVVLSGGVVALVGATGVGKTTTIAKLAARYALRHGRGKIVLVTTDTYRIGALEQLRTYGRILGIPVKIAHNKAQLQHLLNILSEKKFILIDTAGMGQRDVRLMEQFSLINECAKGLRTMLVLSSTTHRAALDETVRTFSNVEINSCILTKLDETTNLGSALSVVTEHQLPVAYISDGQRVPEDLHLARAHTLINRCVTIARRANQPLDNDSLELAYSRMPSHVSA